LQLCAFADNSDNSNDSNNSDDPDSPDDPDNPNDSDPNPDPNNPDRFIYPLRKGFEFNNLNQILYKNVQIVIILFNLDVQF
jgi:hypothetical protein